MKQRIIINILLTISITGLTISCTEIPDVPKPIVTTVPLRSGGMMTSMGMTSMGMQHNGLVFTLESVSFEVNGARLSAMSSMQIDNLVNIVQQHGNKMISIEGHTDNTGDSSYNLSLSEHRAQAVQEALVARGVNPNRIRIQGFGETRPLASNSTRSGRQKNRRVEIIILD